MRSGMTKSKAPAAALGWMPAAILGLMVTQGCHRSGRIEAPSIATRWSHTATIAVAPAINLSGSNDFDPNRFADLMASELAAAEGVSVVPVSRVLALLAVQGTDRVESPAHAWEVAKQLNADAILVFAVTEYDPYDPPRIGLTAQLYGRAPAGDEVGLDPVALSRQPGLEGTQGAPRRDGLLAQTQRVFDASQDRVVAEIKGFAAHRTGSGSPYGWRRYTVSQQDYIRFCCHQTIRALLDGPREPQRKASGNGEPRR